MLLPVLPEPSGLWAAGLSCLDPFAALHEPFGEVSVVGFQTIVVTHDDQVAVTAPVVLRDADPAVESRINGIARFDRNIDSLMAPAVADAVFGPCGDNDST